MQYSDFENKLKMCRNKTVLLGFSGGADSCALFLILEYWSKRIPFDFVAVHFEHGLRGGDSLQDAEFCEKTAAKYGVKFRKYHLNVHENMLKNETIEAAARRLRLEKWQEICRDLTDFEIHLAHHANDLAENVLLRLFRGANVSGLSGLRENSELYGMSVRRIMLDFSREDVENFLTAENFGSYCTDKSNFDCTIGRNYLRNNLLRGVAEVFPYAFKGIIRSAEVCEIDADFIEESAAVKYAEIAGADVVPNDFYKNLHPALQVRILRMYLSCKLGREFIPDRNLMLRLGEMFNSENRSIEQKIELDSENFYVLCDGFWHLESRNVSVPDDVLWDWQNEKTAVFGDFVYSAEFADEIVREKGRFCFNAAALTPVLQIGSRRHGEVFEKFGGGHTSVKEELTNHKIHGIERDKVGILRNGSGEIMLVGDFRRSSFGTICTKNQKIIAISVEKLKK